MALPNPEKDPSDGNQPDRKKNTPSPFDELLSQLNQEITKREETQLQERSASLTHDEQVVHAILRYINRHQEKISTQLRNDELLHRIVGGLLREIHRFLSHTESAQNESPTAKPPRDSKSFISIEISYHLGLLRSHLSAIRELQMLKDLPNYSDAELNFASLFMGILTNEGEMIKQLAPDWKRVSERWSSELFQLKTKRERRDKLVELVEQRLEELTSKKNPLPPTDRTAREIIAEYASGKATLSGEMQTKHPLEFNITEMLAELDQEGLSELSEVIGSFAEDEEKS